jgi:biopolymer transport protein TolR
MGVSVGGGGPVKSEPNVVPMIDIMLVLLIIFMIVTPIISSGFQATMPLSKNADTREEDAEDVVLGIDKEGNYYVTDAFAVKESDRQNIKSIGAGQLEEQLRRIFDTRTKDKILYLKADRELDFGTIQAAMEIARNAGVRVLAAITEQKRDEAAGFLGG